jgi:hypothetical protein
MSGSAVCRYCHRPLIWAETERGANLCVDVNPRATGGYVIEATGVDHGRVQFAVRPARPDDPPELRRTCHLDTCPQRARPPATGG